MEDLAKKYSATEAELVAAGKTPIPHGRRVMTCRNHPDLRWDTKREFGRSIFFLGKAYDPPRYYTDFSGLVCGLAFTADAELADASECTCPASDLITAPEDKVLNPDLYQEGSKNE